MKIIAYDALVIYLFLNGDVDLTLYSLGVVILLRKLHYYTKSSFFVKIAKVLAIKMCVNFILNDHVVSNQRTIVFLMCMQKAR